MEKINYTELKAGETPTFGKTGTDVIKYQADLNVKNQGLPGYTPILTDGMFGPKTLEASKFNPSIVSTQTIHKTGKQNSIELNDMLERLNTAPQVETTKPINYKADPIMQGLTNLATRGDASNQRLVQNIIAQKTRREANLENEYDSYKRGLQLLGIQTNQAQATPDLLMGHIKQAENEKMSKLYDLDAELNKALADAEDARANFDFMLLEKSMARVKELKTEQKNALKDFYDTISTQQKISEIQAQNIYDELENLNDDEKELYLIEVSKRFNLPLNSLVKGIADEKMKREDRDLDIRNKKSIIADREKPKSSGNKGGDFSDQELRKLEQAGIDPETQRQEALDFLYGKETTEDFYSLADMYTEDAPNLDEKGFITAEAFDLLLKEAQKNKVSRNEILLRYKDKLYLDKYKYAKNYGITKKEFDTLTAK